MLLQLCAVAVALMEPPRATGALRPVPRLPDRSSFLTDIKVAAAGPAVRLALVESHELPRFDIDRTTPVVRATT